MNEEEEMRRQGIEAEIRVLKSALCYGSEIGDWKVLKIYEARMAGKPDPYDFDDLAAKRNAARSRINELEQRLLDFSLPY